jgi:hypothetical protein
MQHSGADRAMPFRGTLRVSIDPNHGRLTLLGGHRKNFIDTDYAIKISKLKICQDSVEEMRPKFGVVR